MTNKKTTTTANTDETTEVENTEVETITSRERPKRRKVYERPSATSVPKSVEDKFAEKGYALRLVRWSLKGEPDYRYLNRREQEGYEFVTVDELPKDYAAQVRIRDTQTTKGLVTNGGDLCLMKIDVDLRQSRIDYYDQQARDELNSVDIHVLEKRGLIQNTGSKSTVILREPSFQE